MANDEHLALLRQGSAIWNEWRERNPGEWQADLSEADLSMADLIEADLSRANLREANLSGAYLGVADLSRANLTGANFSEADLSGANLSGADLSGADRKRPSSARTPGKSRVFAPAAMEGTGETDSSLEGDGFELFVPPHG